MARQPNKMASSQITATVANKFIEDVDLVLETGYFGKTRSEAIERLAAEGLRGLMREGTLIIKRDKRKP